MTITRADVEARCSHTPGEFIAELCRVWLAVDDAKTGQTLSYEHGVCRIEAPYIPAGTYKLVCIDTPAGGRETE